MDVGNVAQEDPIGIILGDSLREQPGFETQLVWPVTGLDAKSVVDR